ncbi:MAG: Bor family protein [Bdellovibrionales bacterium]|nr:Bor family protein [Bdellovibrionales bacterium]
MKLLAIGFVLVLSSCATQHFVLKEGPRSSLPNFEGKNHFIFWGIGQEHLIKPLEVCGKDQTVGAVDTHLTFVDGLLASLTWGIYYPRSYAIYCSKN